MDKRILSFLDYLRNENRQISLVMINYVAQLHIQDISIQFQNDQRQTGDIHLKIRHTQLLLNCYVVSNTLASKKYNNTHLSSRLFPPNKKKQHNNSILFSINSRLQVHIQIMTFS